MEQGPEKSNLVAITLVKLQQPATVACIVSIGMVAQAESE